MFIDLIKFVNDIIYKFHIYLMIRLKEYTFLLFMQYCDILFLTKLNQKII